MKKYFILIMIFCLFTINASAQGINVVLNGQSINFDTSPVIVNDRVLIPVRATFESLNATVSWDEKERTVSIDADFMTIKLTVDKEIALIYRKYDFTGLPEEVKLDSPAKIIDDRTYVPIRFIAESLGLKVSWNDELKTVILENKTDIIPVESPVTFTKIKANDLESEELKDWYNQNHSNKGVYYKTEGNATYILASLGEKPTGGYGIDITDITMVSPYSLAVSAKVSSPSPDMMVTQAITYPSAIVKIDKVEIKNLYIDFQ